MNAAERGESQGFGGDIRGLVGRWPDADGILQGGMSDGLRDWDLWSVSDPVISDLIWLTLRIGAR
jgi:hypothetical protein